MPPSCFPAEREAAWRAGAAVRRDGRQEGRRGSTAQLPVLQLLPPAHVCQAWNGVGGGQGVLGRFLLEVFAFNSYSKWTNVYMILLLYLMK